jgi:hypothetical protein
VSGLKWKTPTTSTLQTIVGGVEFSASKFRDGWWLLCDDKQTVAIATLDEAKTAIEKHVRAMFEDLREHFDPVPVLRWEPTSHDYKRDAHLGQWRLEATNRAWSVSLYEANADPLRIFPASGAGASLAENQRAAETALRALGVAFRVEGA